MSHGTTFKVGETYYTRSFADWDCVFEFTITGRTAQFVKYTYFNENRRAKLSVDRDGNEYILPLGRYSMAPVLTATKVKEAWR